MKTKKTTRTAKQVSRTASSLTSTVDITLKRGSGLSVRESRKNHLKVSSTQVASELISRNKKGTTRVFVAGGSRSGHDKGYAKEAYLLGQAIGCQNYRLNFGLSSRGIMGAVAEGVLDAWTQKSKNQTEATKPIQAVTTKEYFALYQKNQLLDAFSEVIVAHTLEERKKQLLAADFVIFAPGGVGTLDELAYDCVAMQDGFLTFKPFVLFNVEGFFHHLLEYLKEMHLKGFADAMPFIVVDDSFEASIAFEMIARYYPKKGTRTNAMRAVEKIIYDLPYVIDQKRYRTDESITAILDEKDFILSQGKQAAQQQLSKEIETAYLNKEITRLYERLAKSGRDTAVISDKLSQLKKQYQGD